VVAHKSRFGVSDHPGRCRGHPSSRGGETSTELEIVCSYLFDNLHLAFRFMSNKTSPHTARFCETIFLIRFLAVTGFSQELGEIAGTVKDSKGFPIPNAVVETRRPLVQARRAKCSSCCASRFDEEMAPSKDIHRRFIRPSLGLH
jgi:hypothetical protein